MPEPGLRDSAKLNTIADTVSTIAHDQKQQGTKLQELADGIKQLRYIVVEGNGKPALLERVAKLEHEWPHDHANIDRLFAKFEALDVKLDQLTDLERARSLANAEAHNAQMTAIENKKESSRRERIGWLVAIGSVVIGSVLSAYLGK